MTWSAAAKTTAKLALFVLAPLALLSAGCTTQPGTAAYVGDARITIDRLTDEVDKAADDPYWGEAVQADRAVATQHTLNVLVLDELLRRGAHDLDVNVERSAIDAKIDTFTDAPGQRAPLLQGVPVELAARTDAYIEAVGEIVVGDATTREDIDARWNTYLEKLIDKYPVKINPRYGVLEPGTLVLIAAADPAVKDV